MDKQTQTLRAAYNVTMNFIESESQKKKPCSVGSVPWKKFKSQLSFMEKGNSDRVVNWLIENWPPSNGSIIPYLSENERNAFDSEAYQLLLRSCKTGMVPDKFVDEVIVRGLDTEGIYFSSDFLQNCMVRFWEISMQDIQQAWIN